MVLKLFFQRDGSFHSHFSFYLAISAKHTHERSLVLTAWKIRPNYIFITYQTPFINIKWLRFLCSGFSFSSKLQRKEDAAISRFSKKKKKKKELDFTVCRDHPIINREENNS